MDQEMEDPAARPCANRVQNAISLAAIGANYIPQCRATQLISRKFGLHPVIAALVAELAGIGMEART
jgi:hypothetical protein